LGERPKRKKYTTMNTERITTEKPESSPIWEDLEGWMREEMQHYIQNLLEGEVTELLGREKSEGRSMTDERAELFLERDWERMTAFCRHPKEQGTRYTNGIRVKEEPIERDAV
jgi:hypothetical protein